jgi:hypothetical protein
VLAVAGAWNVASVGRCSGPGAGRHQLGRTGSRRRRAQQQDRTDNEEQQ